MFEYSSMLDVNGVFHSIGGGGNTIHVAWNTHNDETILMHNFKKIAITKRAMHQLCMYHLSKGYY